MTTDQSQSDPRTGEVYEPTGLVPLLRALCAAQAEMSPALRDRTNPHLRTRYADLTSVWEALRGPLTRHGLVATHRLLMEPEGERMTLETSLWHAASGTALSTLYPLAAVRSAGAQQLGAALTYARRYSLLMLVCGTTADEDDDDGHAASPPPRAPAPPPRAAAIAPRGAATEDTTAGAAAAPSPLADRIRGATLADLGQLASEAAAAGDAMALELTYVRSMQLASSQDELDAIGASCKAEPLFAALPKRRPDAVAAAYAARLRELREEAA